MSRAPVNLLSPILPDASASLAGIADNLNQRANRDVERAKIASQATLAKAQIDAEQQMSEAQIASREKVEDKITERYGEYQDFQSREAEKERAASAQQQQAQRQHDEAMMQRREAADRAMFDRDVALQTELAQIELDHMAEVGKQAAALAEKRREKISEQKKLRASMAAAGEVLGKTEEEILVRAGQLSASVEQMIALHKAADDAMTAAGESLAVASTRNAIDALNEQGIDSTYFSKRAVGESILGRAMGREKMVREAAGAIIETGMEDKIVEAMDLEFAKSPETSFQSPEDRAKFKTAIGLLLEVTTGHEGAADKHVMEYKTKEAGRLLNEVAQANPMKSAEIKYLINGLGKQFAELADAATLKETIKGSGADDARKMSEQEIGAMADWYRRAANIRGAFDAAGVETFSRQEAAMALQMIVKFAEQGGDPEKAMIELGPKTQEFVRKFVRESAPGLTGALQTRALTKKQIDDEAQRQRDLELEMELMAEEEKGGPTTEVLGKKKKALEGVRRRFSPL